MIRAAVFILAFAVLSGSCSKQSLKTAWSTQEDRIDSFIQGLPVEKNLIATELDPVPDSPDSLNDVTYNKGASRAIMYGGTGDRLEEGGTVSFYYAGYTFSGSISANSLFATNNSALATEYGWTVTDGDYSVKTIKLGSDDGLVEGLHNGLLGVRAGEVCYILFSGQYGFGKRKVGTVAGNSALLYIIWVESVSN